MALSEEALFQIRRGERLLRAREQRRRELRGLAERSAAVLRAELGAQRVWVFGSVVRPWFHEASDLDLAAEGIAPERRAEAWARAIALAGDTAVDLVCLEDAPPLLRERVLSDGELLC